MLKGVIFDMDGVIVDSEEYICEAAMEFFARHNLTVQPEDFIPFVGAGENRYIGGVAQKYGFDIDIELAKAETYAIYGEIVKGKLQPLSGVHDFIRECRSRGLKLALASSADRIKVVTNLNEISLPPETFDVVVCGQDVERKKPNPDIFLMAACKLNLEASECLVIEDAVNGVAAAKKAGARCLGLTTSFTPDDLKDADWIAPTLAEAPKEALDW